MAYGNFLASVPVEEIGKLRQMPAHVLNVDVIEEVSHLVAYWVKVQPLGRLLGQALDGGSVISATFQHPFRDPVFHTPEDTLILYRELTQAWTSTSGAYAAPEIGWFRIDISRVLRVFGTAVARSHCVISFLGPPMDQERASVVRIPAFDQQ